MSAASAAAAAAAAATPAVPAAALEQIIAADFDDGAAAPAAPLERRLRAAMKVVTPLRNAMQGGSNPHRLFACDISGSTVAYLTDGTRGHGMSKHLIALMRHAFGIVSARSYAAHVTLFGSKQPVPELPTLIDNSDAAMALLEDIQTYNYGTYSRYIVDALGAGGHPIMIMITDGELDDPDDAIRAISASPHLRAILMIVTNSDATKVDKIANPMRTSVTLSPTPKSLEVVHVASVDDYPRAMEAIQAVLTMQFPRHARKKVLVGGLLLDMSAPTLALVDAIRTMVEAGRITAEELDATSQYLIGTLRAMGGAVLMKRLASEVPWFMSLNSVMLRVHKAHAHAYDEAIKDCPELAAQRREAAQAAHFQALVDHVTRGAGCGWTLRPPGPVDKAVLSKAVSSRDPWPLLQLLKNATIDATGPGATDAVTAAQVCDCLRLAFSEHEIILDDGHALMIAASVVNGAVPVQVKVRAGTSWQPNDDLWLLIHAQGPGWLETMFGADSDIDPVLMCPAMLRVTATLVSAAIDAGAELTPNCRRRSMRAARYGVASRLAHTLASRDLTTCETISGDDGLRREHAINLLLLVRMREYSGDPFPEFPSVVLALWLPRYNRMALVYLEQPDAEHTCSDVLLMTMGNFLAGCAEVIGSMPAPDMGDFFICDRFGASLRRYLDKHYPLLLGGMAHLAAVLSREWIAAGGDRSPRARINVWRGQPVATRGERPRTGHLAPGRTVESVRAAVYEHLAGFIETVRLDPHSGVHMVSGLQAVTVARPVSRGMIAVAAACAGGPRPVVPAWMLMPRPAITPVQYVMLGPAAVAGEEMHLPNLEAVPFEVLSACCDVLLSGTFVADVRVVEVPDSECTICFDVVALDAQVRRCPNAPATHIMCAACYAGWVAATHGLPSCPMCRAPLAAE